MIKIDQALHGYSRGHKELASSIALDDRSRTIMLMMSDLLAVTDLQPRESYLAVYPLKSASRHVIARTWAAGRNFRPGSVWTHSLILDYQALTLITDLVSLLSHFEMPVDGALRAYGQSLEIDAHEQSAIFVGPDARISTAVRQVYGSNLQQVVVLPHLTAERDEVLMMALWRQMWPGLRRDFAALTNLGDGPVGFECGCSIRFARQAPIVDDEPSPGVEEGLKELEADLPEPGPTALRSFLSRYAIEGREPRRLAAALAASRGDDALPMDLRLRRVRALTEGALLPRLVRDFLTQEFRQVENSAALLSLVRFARNETVDVDLTAPMKLASNMSIDDLGDLIATAASSAPHELGARLHSELIKNLPLDRLAAVAHRDERFRMVALRPELLLVPSFWPPDDTSRAAIVQELASNTLDISDALEVFGRSIGPRTLSALMSRAGDLAPDAAVSLLKIDEGAVRDEIAAWVVSSPDRLRLIADRWNTLDRRVVETLTGAQLSQGELPNDPQLWVKLIERVIGDGPSNNGSLNIIGYLCSLALPMCEGLVVASAVFDPLCRAVRDRTLSRVEERYLSNNVSRYSRSWSLSKSLIQSAVSKWPATSIEAGAFAITRSEAVEDDLIDEILIRSGKPGLEAILQSPYLSKHARGRIQRKLTPAKSGKRSNPWSWIFDE